MPIIRQIPTTKIANYSPVVQFQKEFVIIEHTLIANDLFVPDKTKLLIGAKTVYKLIGDGIHTPSFSNDFIADPLSSEYNRLEDAVNIVTFIYDGIAFRYSVTSYTSIDLPPYAVADYDLDDTVIAVGLHRVIAAMFTNSENDIVGQVSVFDIISSVHYTGVLPLQYGIRLPDYPGSDWVWSPNAKDAKALVDCLGLGQWTVEVQITDGVISSDVVTSAVTFQDNTLICGE